MPQLSAKVSTSAKGAKGSASLRTMPPAVVIAKKMALVSESGPTEGQTAVFWVFFLTVLALAPVFKVPGFVLAPKRSLQNPMQLPFLPVGKVDGKRAWWQIWTPIAGVLNNALFIVAAVVGARSGVLGGAAKACGNNVLIPVGIMGVVLHTQMGYDKLVNKNQVATNLALGLCTLGQVAFSGLVLAPFLPALLRSHETLLATASGAATLGCTLAATATFVSVMAIRLAVLASCGFNLKEFEKRYFKPQGGKCPFPHGEDEKKP